MARKRGFYIDAVVKGYFGAMDAGDIEGTVSCFAPDATLTWETNDVVLNGHDQLRTFFTALCEGTNAMAHKATNFVIDTEKETCAVELVYRNDRKDGVLADMVNCNFFDFGPDGRFTRVHFWTGSVVE